MSRITGLATGLDVDALVEETMNAYQTKIDVVDQQMKLAELQQGLYRGVITDCRDFYDKYFDISKSDSILLEKNWASASFTSSNSSVVTATAVGSATVDNYDVKVVQLAEPAQYTITDSDLASLSEITITVKVKEKDADGKEVEKDKPITIKFEDGKSSTEKATIINSSLKEYGMSAKYSSFSKGITISTTSNGSNQSFKIDNKEVLGKDCVAQITNSQNQSYDYIGSNNNVTVDGVKFTFTGVNAKGSFIGSGKDAEITVSETTSEAKLTGKSDVESVKDNLVKFINDYNTLMERLNTLINEERDSDYMPLTDAQKEEMTESQIELWEKKVASGQLRRDSDLTRIRNAMKTAMSTLVGDSGKTLASFGIKSVSDYSGNKNGTFTIDETALTEALENNFEDVKSLFISKASTTEKDKDKIFAANGTLYRLKSLFDSETQSSSGSLLKKAGMEGSSTSSNNTLSKKIAKYEEKIERMESLFATKQQALYTKYARLETLMNNLNSQQSYLSSMFSS